MMLFTAALLQAGSAIHAACALDTGLFVGQDADKLAVMFEA
jgi:hypothetical protein